MPRTSIPPGNRTALSLAPLFALSLALIATGCASPGPPRPPALNLPQPVTDLTAQRVGDQVLFHWTTPTKSTDGLALKGSFTARICRITEDPSAYTSTPANPAPPNSSSLCLPVLRTPTHPGPATAAETLPTHLAADPVALLDYRLEIENPAGHSAGPSNRAYALAGAAPPPILTLRATTIPTGVMLEWPGTPVPTSPAETLAVELDRLNPELAATPRKAAPAPTSTAIKPKPARSPIKPKPSQPVQLDGAEPAEVHLRTPSQQSQNNSLAGTIDHTAQFDQTYRYTAQRVRTLSIAGHPFEIRSLSSNPVNLTLHDTFPPATPTGLAAIPNQPTSTQQPTPQTASIDLSWDPNAEPDLAGYLVYRQAVATTPANPIRLTSAPIPGPAYRDLSAVPGQTYRYTVTAIDTHHNESAPSAPTQETLPSP